jgi:hypothetical protein
MPLAAAKTTPPLWGTPPREGNGTANTLTADNSPPLEGWQAQPDGVVFTAQRSQTCSPTAAATSDEAAKTKPYRIVLCVTQKNISLSPIIQP